jgi:hypothetical protein
VRLSQWRDDLCLSFQSGERDCLGLRREKGADKVEIANYIRLESVAIFLDFKVYRGLSLSEDCRIGHQDINVSLVGSISVQPLSHSIEDTVCGFEIPDIEQIRPHLSHSVSLSILIDQALRSFIECVLVASKDDHTCSSSGGEALCDAISNATCASRYRGAIKQLLTDWLHFNGCLALSANG